MLPLLGKFFSVRSSDTWQNPGPLTGRDTGTGTCTACSCSSSAARKGTWPQGRKGAVTCRVGFGAIRVRDSVRFSGEDRP